MSIYNAYCKALAKLNVQQNQYLPAIEWLLNTSDKARDKGSVRATGRSTLMALAFIRDALMQPGRWIKTFDHIGFSHGGNDIVQDKIRGILGPEFQQCQFRNHQFRIYLGGPFTVGPAQFQYFPQETDGKNVDEIRKTARDTMLEDIHQATFTAMKLGSSAEDILKEVNSAIVEATMAE